MRCGFMITRTGCIARCRIEDENARKMAEGGRANKIRRKANERRKTQLFLAFTNTQKEIKK